MKVTNWRKKLIESLLAAGILVPSASYAVDIPLGDPSFDLYTVPSRGYAYAADPLGAYRPTSPWVDDLDNPPGFTKDNNISNWIYNSNYAEVISASNKRAAPRTGGQAMHGLDGNFNAQELTNVFEANKTYTFSIWAQDDVNHDQNNGASLYIFDGNVTFNPLGTGFLSKQDFTGIPQRTAAMTMAQSQANWQQITISHTVAAGAPEVGHPIGVGFRGFRDTSVDDAALTAVDAITQALYLEVNTTNGTVRLKNQTGTAVNIDYYEITSGQNALNTSWTGLQNASPAISGFPQGNGSGNGWEKAGGSSSSVLAESYLTGNSGVANGANLNLGTAFNVGGSQLLQFKYGKVTTVNTPQTGDYNNNGVVDAADYVLWKNGGPLANDPSPGVQASDYDQWRANFGHKAATSSSSLVTGGVIYVTAGSGAGVPEPASVILVGIGAVVLVISGRKRNSSI